MFETFVALRHIRFRRRQTLLAVGAVTMAVAITIISRASVNGFQEVLLDIVFEEIPHVVISPKEGEEYIYLYRSLLDTIWAIPGVTAVSPSLTTTATLAYKDNVENVALSGVIPAELDEISGMSGYKVEGDLLLQSGRRVLLSQKTADKLEVEVGDRLRASFPDADPLFLVVTGIFNSGVAWDDFAFVSLETARDFLGEGDVITDVQIKLEDIYEAGAVAAEISARGYRARSWQSLFPEILRTIRLERFSNNLVMLLILVISSFGIANVMNMLVLEKTGEIGMLAALGASPTGIRRLFVLEAAILGLIGGVCGCLLGYLSSLYLDTLKLSFTQPSGQTLSLPFIVNPWDLATFTLFAVLLSALAGLYPAHKASRLDPIAAIRG